MKVTIPRKIKMLTHTYDIVFDNRELAASSCIGLTRFLHQKIILSKGVEPDSELNQIFLHEILHTIERHFGMKLDDMDIDRLAEGLAVFLFDNLGIEFDWEAYENGDIT